MHVLQAAPAARVWSGANDAAIVPWPAFHWRMCRIAPVALVSTYATLVPSSESMGDVDAEPVLDAAVWYDHITLGPFRLHSPPTLPCVEYS